MTSPQREARLEESRENAILLICSTQIPPKNKNGLKKRKIEKDWSHRNNEAQAQVYITLIFEKEM